MAAFETPWLSSMSTPSTYTPGSRPSTPQPTFDPNPPTLAAFSPSTLSGASAVSKHRSTIIVHKKSPLLVATPPQITRALAYSHPFLLPLNKLAGLLSWTSDDPWESFLMVAGFWAVVLYGSSIIRWAGPIIIVVALILGMYSRRYSPLSSTSQTGEKHGHKREPSDASARHQKSLDEIVETLRSFTTRCNLLLDPFLRLTDFLSTQRTATSATTRPALTTLFIRILLVTPLWISLSLPPFYILTSRRVVLLLGTVTLTWHSRPARVSRVILWRSLTVRRICAFITGLSISPDDDQSKPNSDSRLRPPPLPPRRKSQIKMATDIAMRRRPDSSGVRFTFILYENQRRWLGLGWTTSLFAYERGPWTDEHLNPAPSLDEFELPDMDTGNARWRWLDDSRWRIEGGSKEGITLPAGDGGGWIYYDSKWNDGKRDVDSWGRYTRRRKWYRDAELVEVTPSTEVTPIPSPGGPLSEVEDEKKGLKKRSRKKTAGSSVSAETTGSGGSGGNSPDNDSSSTKAAKKKGWFGEKKPRERGDSRGSGGQKSGVSVKSAGSVRSDGPEDDHLDLWRSRDREEGGRGAYGLGDDAVMGLG